MHDRLVSSHNFLNTDFQYVFELWLELNFPENILFFKWQFVIIRKRLMEEYFAMAEVFGSVRSVCL